MNLTLKTARQFLSMESSRSIKFSNGRTRTNIITFDYEILATWSTGYKTIEEKYYASYFQEMLDMLGYNAKCYFKDTKFIFENLPPLIP